MASKSLRGALYVLLFAFVFALLPTTTVWAGGNDKCENLLGGAPLETAAELKAKRDEAMAVGPRVNDYFKALGGKLLERDYVIEDVLLALIAREHVLLMGPPGNAKSLLADQILGNIFEAAQKADGSRDLTRSYYRIQMTPETTMSETHGPLDFKSLTETGKYERLYDEGMLNSRNVFIDEIFDGRANSMRNILGLLAERAHAQGPRIIPGRIETVVAATNKYISEVYERVGDDSPKALLDRFAFSAFVPGEFEGVDSYVNLIRGARKSGTKLPELTFDDLEKVRRLVPDVEVPRHVAEFLSLLSYRVKGETEAMEQAALKSYKQALRNGEEPAPPYRATKYHSPRTLSKAAGILKAIVVREWLKSGGKRPLTANFEDVRRLEGFFTLGGPSDEFIQGLLERASNPHERAQLQAILQERQVFRRNFDAILGEVNSGTYKYALVDLQSEVDNAKTASEKEVVGRKLIKTLLEMEQGDSHGGRQTKLTGEQIGRGFVRSYLEDTLHEMLGDKYEEVVGHALADIEAAKKAAIEEAKRAEQERIENERKRELEQKAAAEAEARRIAELKARIEKIAEPYKDAARVQVLETRALNAEPPHDLVAVSRDGQAIVHYQAQDRSLIVIKPEHKNGPTTWAWNNSGRDAMVNNILGLSNGNISKVLLPDADNVVVITDNNMGFVVNVNSGEFVQEFMVPNNARLRPTLSADGAEIIAYDFPGRRMVAIDWKSGSRRSQVIKGVSGGNDLGTALNAMNSSSGLIIPTADGSKIRLLNDNPRLSYEFDPGTGLLTHVGPQAGDPGMARPAGFSADRSKLFSWRYQNGELVINETSLADPSQIKTLKANVGALNQIKDVTVIEDGSLALVATWGNGLVLVDLVNGQLVTQQALGSSAHVSYVRVVGDKVITSQHEGGNQIRVIRRK